MADVAAALASLAQGRTPLILSGKRAPDVEAASPALDNEPDRSSPEAAGHNGRKGSRFGPQQTYRIEVGRSHGVQPGNIVGAIANEADLDGSQINGIDIQDDHSFVRLPAGMPPETLERLQRVRVKGRPLAAAVVEHGKPRRTGTKMIR
jgi:ATP-dependent RNA helicase DeaD